jgi:hypothetical protein
VTFERGGENRENMFERKENNIKKYFQKRINKKYRVNIKVKWPERENIISGGRGMISNQNIDTCTGQLESADRVG